MNSGIFGNITSMNIDVETLDTIRALGPLLPKLLEHYHDMVLLASTVKVLKEKVDRFEVILKYLHEGKIT